MSYPFELIIASKDEAAKLLCSRRRPRWLVSLGAPETTPPEGWAAFARARKLRLWFDDIDRPGHPWYIPPSEEHVADLLRFGEQIDHGQVLVHCAAGISRSTASAFTLLTQALGPGSEMEALQHVYDIRSPTPNGDTIHPNALLVQIADDLLGRGGAMRQALLEIGGY